MACREALDHVMPRLGSPALPAQNRCSYRWRRGSKYRHLSDQTPVPLALSSVMWSRELLSWPRLPGPELPGSFRAWGLPAARAFESVLQHLRLCRVLCGQWHCAGCNPTWKTGARTRPDPDLRPSSNSGLFSTLQVGRQQGEGAEGELNTFTLAHRVINHVTARHGSRVCGVDPNGSYAPSQHVPR